MKALAGVNKAVLVALLAFVAVAGGALWYRLAYSPAKLELTTAKSGLQQAEAQVAAKRTELSKLEVGGVDRASLAEIIIGKRAIPRDEDGDEAMVELDRLAQRAGVEIRNAELAAGAEAAASSASGQEAASGALPLDITLEASGTYPGMIMFVDQVQDLVDDKRGKVYITGRLFNVTSLTIGDKEGEGSSEQEPLPKGHLRFTLVLRTFSSNASPASSAPGADPAAAGGTGAPADPAAAGQAGAPPAGTDPAAAGGAPSAGATGAPGAAGSGSAPAPTTPSTSSVPVGTS